MSKTAKHTNYLLVNEKGELEMVNHSPEQNYSGQRASDSYALAQGLFIDDISHDLWLTEVSCHRVLGTPSGLQSIKGLKCKIVAKWQYDWDMSKPMGERAFNQKKSNRWDECYSFYKNNETK